MSQQYMKEIMEKCTACGSCAISCPFLTEAGDLPRDMAVRGVMVSEAFSCCLCGACETACDQGLSPQGMFADRRFEAIRDNEFDINKYRYLFPDRSNNVMSAYRRYAGIDYSDIDTPSGAGICFFPGCTLMTYSPDLTRAVFDRLKNSCGCDSMWTSCCGKPLEQMGLRQRLRDTRANLKEFAQKYKIRRIITACSGCYYDLQSLFQSSDVAIQTVYEVMDFSENAGILGKRCAVHDSCPDRYAGTFGKQVRQALARKGFTIVEMLHNQTNTICCGSGGQLSHFRPDLVEKLVSMRLAEARQADADILAGYCLSCVLKYGSKSEIPVAHVLNLLLDIEADFKGAKERAAKMLSGPDGEKLWEQIMAD